MYKDIVSPYPQIIICIFLVSGGGRDAQTTSSVIVSENSPHVSDDISFKK